MENVNTLVKQIKEGLSQVNASHKDEVAVMQAMLNDPSYEVQVFAKNGTTSTYNPCKEFRGMCSTIISSTTKIPASESQTLMEGYTVKKSEADAMVGISKEFVNTFLHTGRKLPLGGREMSDISLRMKEVPETTRSCPRRVGVDQYSRVPTTIPAHEVIRVHAPCPAWKK